MLDLTRWFYDAICPDKGKFRFHKFPKNGNIFQENVTLIQRQFPIHTSGYVRNTSEKRTSSITNPHLKKNFLSSLFIPEDNPVLEELSISEEVEETTTTESQIFS